MSKIVEKWSDGRPKTIKSDATNTIYPEIGKGSLTRKMKAEDKAKFDAEMQRIFPAKQKQPNTMNLELEAFRASLKG